MLNRRLSIVRQPLVLAVLGVAAASAIFASGVLVTRATASHSPATPAPHTNTTTLPAIASDAVASAGGGALDQGGAGVPASGYTSPAQGTIHAPGGKGYCPGTLGNVITGTAIDPSKVGFVPSLLTGGFELQGISLRAEGVCDANGRATSSHPALNSNYVDAATQVQVYVNQNVSSTPQPDILGNSHATFTSNGYDYSVNVNGGQRIPVDIPPGKVPAMPSGPAVDPQAAAILRAAIAQLAPKLSADCFYTEASGDWSNLGGLGLGDPRTAIPAGFTLRDMQLSTYAPPVKDCGSPAPPTLRSFNAGWQSSSGFLGVSVNPIFAGMNPGAGSLNGYGAHWATSRYQFNVFAKFPNGVGLSTVQAIAKAIDPSFDATCLVQQRDLLPGELAGLGFRAPSVPNGYKLASSMLRVDEVSASCTNPPPGTAPTYNLHWSLTGPDGNIDANEARFPFPKGGKGVPQGSPQPTGSISDFGINWTDARGTNYSVFASGPGTSPTPQRGRLIAIAKSMDPTLDVTKLQQQPGQPIPYKGSGSSSTGVSGSAVTSAALPPLK